MSVYKELVAELQSAKALSEALNAQNQQLQQELEKATELVLYWRQANKGAESAYGSFTDTRVANHNLPSSKEGTLPLLPKSAKFPAPQIAEQEQGRYRRQSSQRVGEISSWSLAIAIVLIMVTAFGAGYFMMRPLVRSR
ncbi:MAG: hypothetical protein KME01_09110 [Chroococcus sp. CMT-3BRIN-NPC107]|jgi:cobalamin biosynthesis Mg chelatase CobN|nr:hypothetical protein [Chroococcus sp. CMT-3BRIN-NPC107]